MVRLRQLTAKAITPNVKAWLMARAEEHERLAQGIEAEEAEAELRDVR